MELIELTGSAWSIPRLLGYGLDGLSLWRRGLILEGEQITEAEFKLADGEGSA